MHPLKSIQIKKTNDPTYGVWSVSTEADSEGRTDCNLGLWEGHIDEIALHLANKAMYGLRFKHFEPVIEKPGDPTKANVHISIESKELLDIGVVSVMFSDRPVTVCSSCYYKSFEIIGDQENIKRKIALSKLTDEERKILGL
ncbi:hypothetical protein M2419_001519 [Sphingobacterium sp. BIGb0116]|nr:hypothetical protein [Sphingobacterium sp. BIGb0116]